MHELGKIIVIAGAVLVGVGLLVMLAGRTHLPIGRLPGDILSRGKNTTVYFPIVTCIVLSILLSFVFWLLSKLR